MPRTSWFAEEAKRAYGDVIPIPSPRADRARAGCAGAGGRVARWRAEYRHGAGPRDWRRADGKPVVRKLSFTGSAEVGALLYAQSAPTIRKLSLELGGNAPFIVFDDADLDQAVQDAIDSKFRNAGQTCVCANRFYVQAGIYDRFVDAFAKAADALKLGRGDDPASPIGLLIDDKAGAKVRSHIEDAIGKGAASHPLQYYR